MASAGLEFSSIWWVIDGIGYRINIGWVGVGFSPPPPPPPTHTHTQAHSQGFELGGSDFGHTQCHAPFNCIFDFIINFLDDKRTDRGIGDE